MASHNLKTTADLARFAEVGWSTAKQWMSGTTPRKHSLDSLASHLGVTSTWLATGEGDREPVNAKAIKRLKEGFVSEPESRFNDGHSHFEDVLRQVISTMPTETVLDHIKKLVEESRKAKAQILIDMLREREKREE